MTIVGHHWKAITPVYADPIAGVDALGYGIRRRSGTRHYSAMGKMSTAGAWKTGPDAA